MSFTLTVRILKINSISTLTCKWENLKQSNNFTTKIYKTFGLTKLEILEKTKFIREEFREIFFEIFEDKLDCTLRITAKEFVEKERVLNCFEKIENRKNFE